MALKKWKTLSKKTVIDNGFWKYNLDEFEISEGNKGEYHYLYSPGSTLIIPFTAENKVILVNQYRYLNEKNGWEFPCGSISEGYTPEENAIKELREESGFTAAKLIKTGEFAPFTGASNEICHIFVARDLSLSPLKADDTEEFEVKEFTLTQFKDLIKSNRIWDGLTLAAYALNINLF